MFCSLLSTTAALYKSSCEEYRHMGYDSSGVYKIDVDGNGPLPPAHVKCDFNSVTGVTTTIVENNLREKYVSEEKEMRRRREEKCEKIRYRNKRMRSHRGESE